MTSRLGLIIGTAILLIWTSSGMALSSGDVAPDLPAGAAARLSLDGSAGRLVYVDFWASWCGSCERSLPWLNELAKRFPDGQLRVIAVNVDVERGKAERLLSGIQPVFEVRFDPEGRLPELYGLRSMPASYLIGPDGKIIASFEDFTEESKIKIEKEISSAREKKTA